MENRNELYHYGVTGMKWGVRRASKRLAKAKDYSHAQKAMKTLDKHREKSSAKLAKLEKKHPKLEKRAARSLEVTDRKAARYKQMAAKHERKAAGIFTSDRSAFKHMRKAAKFNSKAADLALASARTKSRLAKNERLQAEFKKGISKIDEAKKKNGEAYLKNLMKENGVKERPASKDGMREYEIAKGLRNE